MDYKKILGLNGKEIDENSTPMEVRKYMSDNGMKSFDIWLNQDVVVCAVILETPGRQSREVITLSKESGTLRYIFKTDRRFHSLKTLLDYVYKELVKFNKRLTKDLSDDKFTK